MLTFIQIPVTCMVVDHKFGKSMRNCTWSSCREGCTSSAVRYIFFIIIQRTQSEISINMVKENFNILLFRCHKLLVNYSKIPWDEWQKNPPDLHNFEWDVSETRLLINSEGCGKFLFKLTLTYKEIQHSTNIL